MKKHIAEELPARKHAPAEAPSSEKGGEEAKKEGGKTPEKRVKQAIYDIRYRARREELPLRSAYSQYMQNSSMSQQEKTMVKQKLFGKGGIQAEDFNIEDFASSSVANALFKVFIEGVEEEQDSIRLTYMEKLETSEHKKYKVRVTGKDGRSYVRYADRQKISELRGNPNIESVEMTGYGEPYEGEKKRGEQTAKAKAGKGLDPVGREDKDIDNDGDHDKTDKYLLNRRKVRGAAIAKRSGVNEEFIGEVNDETLNSDANEKKIDVMKGKNTVKVNPDVPGSMGGRNAYGMQLAHYDMQGSFVAEKAVSKSQQKFMGMVYAVKKGAKPMSKEVAQAAAGMTEKEARKFAKTKHKGLPEKVEEGADCGCDESPKSSKKGEMDVRELPTKMNLVKNKMRAMGLKMSYEPEGKQIDEIAPLVAGGLALGGAALAGAAIKRAQDAAKSGVDAAKSGAKVKPTGGIAGAAYGLQRRKQETEKAMELLRQNYSPEGEVLDERRKEEKVAGTPRKKMDRAYELIKQSIRRAEGTPVGQQKKVPGKKPPAAGEYGAPRSPAQKVAMRRAAAQRSQEMQSSRFD